MTDKTALCQIIKQFPFITESPEGYVQEPEDFWAVAYRNEKFLEMLDRITKLAVKYSFSYVPANFIRESAALCAIRLAPYTPAKVIPEHAAMARADGEMDGDNS